jgi:excisionase family DNA binding protein
MECQAPAQERGAGRTDCPAVQLAPLNDVLEVAEYLRCGRTHVFALIKSGRLRSVKVGRKRLVPDHCVLAFVEEQASSDRLIR